MKSRWLFLPLGLTALVAVGAHAAADVVGNQVLWIVDHVDAFFDSIFSAWSVTAPLVDLVGLEQRTWFARAVALAWELSADLLLAVPLLGYFERSARDEVQLARALLRKRPTPMSVVRPVATLLCGVAGACAVARMVAGSVLHVALLSHLAGLLVLIALLVLFVPRAALRSLEQTSGLRALGVTRSLVLAPLAIAAVAASPLLSFFR